ncbi:MAG: DUF4443 domain-containing protein [Ignisphaera sp.]
MGKPLALSLKDIVARTLSSTKGVKPSFDDYHVIKTLLILYERGPMGRQLLSKNLGIGITPVRTLIKRLKLLNIIEVDPVAGCFLTSYGYRIAESIRNTISNIIEASNILDKEFLLYEKSYAFLIKKGTAILRQFNVTNVRDHIIRYGAKAVIIIYIENDLAYIPPYREFNEKGYISLKKLRSILKAENEDAIILIFSNSDIEAEKALYSALLELNILH